MKKSLVFLLTFTLVFNLGISVNIVIPSRGEYGFQIHDYSHTYAAANTWSPASSMSSTRGYGHTAIRLNNGKVFVEGNYSGLSAELYNPSTNTWSSAGNTSVTRTHATTTLLNNGKVLVAGGSNNGVPVHSSVEIYDPSTNTWGAAGSMSTTRQEHTATMLNDGKVLVVGGTSGIGSYFSSTEIYDPSTNTWSVAGSMSIARKGHTATLLNNGKVLVVGGVNNTGRLSSAEIYDPSTNTWSAAGNMSTARDYYATVRLHNGKVLAVGGYSGISRLSSAEIYDPSTNTWSPAGNMSISREKHTVTLLNSGKVLVAGGSNGSVNSSAEIYDPSTNTWNATGSMSTARDSHNSVLLNDGKVLVIGGLGASSLSSAEIYDPGNVAPVISISSPVSDQSYSEVTGHTEITITGKVSDSDGGSVKISSIIDGKEKEQIINPVPTNVPGSNNFTLTWDVVTDNITAGTYTGTNISVIADDGNATASLNLASNLIVDKTSPTVNVPTETHTSTSITLTADASDISNPLEYQFNIDGSDKPWQSSNDYTFSGLNSSQQYTIKYKARDSVRNESNYSAPISITTLASGGVTQVSSLSIADNSNYGDARDIRVTFTAPANESNIKEYRIYIVASGSLDKDGALAITQKDKYNIEKKSRLRSLKKHILTLASTQKDTAGVAISPTGTYKVYVLTVGTVSSATTISTESNTKTLSSTSPSVGKVLILTPKDTGDNNDASDLTVVFSRAVNETPIKEYKIFVVPNGTAFNTDIAKTKAEDTLHPERYTTVTALNKKTTKTYTVKLTAGTKNILGGNIQNGIDYDVYVLSVPRNTKVNYYNLSSAANITLH